MSGGVDSHRIEVLEAKLVGVRSELQRQRKVAAKSKDELEKLLGLVEAQNAITDQLSAAPAWLAPKRGDSNLHATAWLTLSDLHLDEVVIRSQSAGLNSYNRKIAEKRLTAVIENTIAVFDEQITGLQLDGIVCALGGDIITGDIHEELMKTNESSVPETIVYWVPVLASAIGRLADRFGKVHVPCVSGNHDRTGKKIQFKNRAQESFSWIIYHWIAAELADDDRVTFDIAEGADKMVKVYKTRFMLTHGDGFRGGRILSVYRVVGWQRCRLDVRGGRLAGLLGSWRLGSAAGCLRTRQRIRRPVPVDDLNYLPGCHGCRMLLGHLIT